jgi:uncharacterized small protein (DUF1192 family)
MFDDVPEPATKPVGLDLMSIEELEKRIARLREEIDNCERAIAAKRDHRTAADAFFTRPAQ